MDDLEQLVDSPSVNSSEDQDDQKKRYRLTIEPIIAIVFLAQCLSDFVLTELFLKRTCTVALQYNNTVCDALGQDTSEGHFAESVVQPHTTVLLSWKLVLSSVIPAILSLFLGPWSDKHGRKPIMVYSLAGCNLMYAMYCVLSYVPNLPPKYLLLASAPLSLLGGYVNLISSSFCYVSDISEPASRTLRLGILEGLLFIGTLIGLSSNSYIFKTFEQYGYGYAAIFGGSGALCFAALVYLTFYVPESVKNFQKPNGIKGVFDLSLPVAMLKTCFQDRAKHRRTVVLLCVTILGLTILNMEGVAQIYFLFTRLQFGWDLQKFTLFACIVMIVTIFGTAVGCWLLPKYVKSSDASRAIIAYSSDIIQYTLYALAKCSQAYFLYIGSSIAFLRGIQGPTIRAILSNAVPPSDLGKVFSFTATVEALAPIAAGPMFVTLYNATAAVFPGAVFFLSASICVLIVILLSVILVIQRKHEALADKFEEPIIE